MLSLEVENKELFNDISSLVDIFSLDVVEVDLKKVNDNTILRVFLSRKDKEITTEDLENAYNVIYPRYSALYNDRGLSLEVTSPGLQRNLKSWYEFSLFTGRDVRIYSTRLSSYVVGKIASVDGDRLTLDNYIIEDKNETGSEIIMNYNEIAKAKLEYRWEVKK